MKMKIFVTRKIPKAGINLLKKKYNVKVSPHDRVLSKKKIMQNVKGVDAILCLLTDTIDEDIMDAAGDKLKVIANYAVGINNIDVGAAKKRKIMVTNTPGVLTDTVAEHAFGLMIALAQRIVEADKYIRAGKFKGWEPMLFLGDDLMEKTLGIIGLGRIGFAVAQRAVNGMGMKVIYNDINRNKNFEKRFQAKYAAKQQLLKKADFVSLHVPLLPATKHLIGVKELKMMKKDAYLINTSRGPVIDEKALITALEKKIIKGAALDVFECEPKLGCAADIAGRFRKLDNAIFTPHIASASIITRSKMSEMAAKNIIAALSGRKPPNIVN